MKHLAAVIVVAVVALGCVGAFGATPDEIGQSIHRGQEHLYKLQKPAGHWEMSDQPPADVGSGVGMDGGQWGGRTALVAYALLASGEKPTDARLAKAVQFLLKANIRGTYALGVRSLVWPYLPQSDEVKAAARADFEALRRGVLGAAGRGPADAGGAGLYDYLPSGRQDAIDLSASQYGVLGVWSAATFGGLDVDDGYWRAVEAGWLKFMHVRDPSGAWVPVRPGRANQLPGDVVGGWAYQGNGAVSASITAAAVASLYVTSDYLRTGEGAQCNGNAKNVPAEAGLRYLIEQLPELVDARATVSWRLYTLYGIERIGVASGLKYLGDLDWYAAGSEYLVRTQANDGGWTEYGQTDIGTAFALLFLARGGEPVMFNKLQYRTVSPRARRAATLRPGATTQPAAGVELPTEEAAWNERSRDVQNLARYVGRQMERSLNWQIVDLQYATALDLADAPVAYLAGPDAVELTAEAKLKLKDYLERGGLLYLNADCGRPRFRAFADALAQELTGRAFEPMPKDHPILAGQQFALGGTRGKTVAARMVSNGARALIVMPEEDTGKAWQGRELRREELFQFGADVFQYAVDKTNLQTKGRTHRVEPNPRLRTFDTVRVARLKWAGNWDPEPGGWRQLAARMHNLDRLKIEAEAIDAGALAAPFKHAHLTGTGELKLTDAEGAALKAFVLAGGTVLVDAAGGDGAFKTSAEALLGRLFPAEAGAGVAQLDPGDPLYAAGAGVPKPLAEVRYRPFAQRSLGGALRDARLRGFRAGLGRVVYSSEDLSVGLVGHHVDGIAGYAPESAFELARRFILRTR